MMTMMMMKDQEETFVCEDQSQVIKGKRSKRPRQPSPLSLAMCSSTTMPMMGMNSTFDPAAASPTTSAESTEEDADMANCLIFLARGGQTRKFPVPLPDVHQCKTCDRSFTSFQALGGHRASHKKPKVVNDEENNKGLYANAHPSLNKNMNTTLSLQVTNSNKVPKVHECSMCGAEFSSGQALGGHMRRHRTLTNVATTRNPRPELSEDKSKKQRTILQLDLNLPAPEDDHQTEITQFSFASKPEKLLQFSSSSLVDCHY